MKVILLAVTSVNGKATRGTDPIIYSWTSKEDQETYFKKLNQAKLIVMGSKTYEHARYLIKHKKGQLRVVITRTPEKYNGEKISGMIEFTNESPDVVLKRHKEIK